MKRMMSVLGGVCIILGVQAAGLILAGLPGQLVGILLSVPLCIAWGIFIGKNT